MGDRNVNPIKAFSGFLGRIGLLLADIRAGRNRPLRACNRYENLTVGLRSLSGSGRELHHRLAHRDLLVVLVAHKNVDEHPA